MQKNRLPTPDLRAETLSVHKSTISRGLNRNTSKRGYRYKQAQERADEPRRVTSQRKTKMSPEPVSEWIKKGCQASISHESI